MCHNISANGGDWYLDNRANVEVVEMILMCAYPPNYNIHFDKQMLLR
jgi:hypothetical protein